MRMLVVRHYKTLNNETNLIMGWGDAPSSKDWDQDPAWVDEILRREAIPIASIHSSGLNRARRTAMYFARRHGIHLIRDCEFLNEVNYGPHLYRKDKGWVKEHFPLHKKDPDFVYPDGESFRQMQKRSVECVLDLERAHAGQTILVVIHAGVIRGLVSYFLDLDYAANLTRKIGHRYIGDFHLEQGVCIEYNELGEPSGFVCDGAVAIPWHRSSSAP
jgi:alpha-ribazole phosphatase